MISYKSLHTRHNIATEIYEITKFREKCICWIDSVHLSPSVQSGNYDYVDKSRVWLEASELHKNTIEIWVNVISKKGQKKSENILKSTRRLKKHSKKDANSNQKLYP